ncbi:restriction endonuclease subunit S [Hugonella massiliensis]|uniref:restriction endonuclease subunit S n=1 Tax=Hugonella massiliensis TaxID=1720315 RepID=UPI0009EBAB23|nr:restriction endonuclease subunit S [Hugonella massiliensis]
MRLNQLCSKGKSSLRQKDIENDGPFNVYGASGIVGRMGTYQNEQPYVAIVKDGAGVGRTMLCEGKTSVLGTMQALLPNEGTNVSYLLHLVRSLKLGENYSGSTIPHIYFKDYGKQEVPALSAGQQSAIAERLDLAEQLMALIDDETAKLDSLVKSRFVEMFGDLDSDDSRPLKDVCSIITDGTHQSPKFVDEGIPFLFVSNIASDVVDYETNKFISAEDYEQLIRRTPIEIGDVLVSAVGSFGHPAVVRDGRPFCFQRHIAYLKPRHNLVDSDYLHAALLSDDAQRYMDRCAKGVAQRTVTLKSFKEMKIPVPSMCLQEEFAAFVSQVDKLRFVRTKC